jgi:hypothetical protein
MGIASEKTRWSHPHLQPQLTAPVLVAENSLIHREKEFRR